MKLQFDYPNERLIMLVSADEQAELQRLEAEMEEEAEQRFYKDDVMGDLLEGLTCNSDFDWVTEGITADLTSAPMLGVFGCDEMAPKKARFELRDFYGTGRDPVGVWDGRVWCRPLLFRWAFMDYAVTSPQVELAKRGRAVWSGGPYLERHGMHWPRDFECSLYTPRLIRS